MREIVPLIALSLTLSGCANGLQGFRPLSYQEPAETRVFVSRARCPSQTGQEVASVLTALAVEAAGQLLTSFNTGLANAAQGGALPKSIAAANFELSPEDNAMPRCLIIIRGRFAGSQAETPRFIMPSIDPAELLGGGPLPQVFELHHYAEIALLGTTNETALRAAVVRVRIDRSMDGSTSGRRELSLGIQFTRPSGGQPQGSVVLLSGLEIRRDYRFEPDDNRRFSYETPWFAFSGLADAPAGTSAQAVPVTVTTTAVETRPSRQFLAFVASVFGAQAPAIRTAVTDEINPAPAQAAERTARATYYTALATALGNVAAYCALTNQSPLADRATKSATARNAQETANAQARDLGLAVPFDQLIAVGGEAPSIHNAQACAALPT